MKRQEPVSPEDSSPTAIYRRCCLRLVDWYRQRFGDERSATRREQPLSYDVELELERDHDGAGVDLLGFLSDHGCWVLWRVAIPLSLGHSLADVASETDRTMTWVTSRLRELRDELSAPA